MLGLLSVRVALFLAVLAPGQLVSAASTQQPGGQPKPAPDKPAATMQAIVVQEYGPPSVLKIQTVPVPPVGDDDILVRVHAAGVNPVDDKLRSAAMGQWAKLPYIPGYDVAGVVETVGKNIRKFKTGDEIFAYVNIQRGGAYAEHMLVKEGETALKPAKLSFTQAAGVPLAALTAYQALVDTARLDKGQTVLIHGAAGGVGHFAVQIAKARGARVIATGSAASQPFLKELGADETIDYSTTKFEDVAKDVDVILDPIGGDTQDRSWKVIKKGGTLVSIIQPPDQAKAAAAGATGTIFLVKPNAAELAEIGKMIDDGKIKVTISKTFPLADAAKAHEQIATGHTKGKVVLEIAAETK